MKTLMMIIELVLIMIGVSEVQCQTSVIDKEHGVALVASDPLAGITMVHLNLRIMLCRQCLRSHKWH